MKIERATTINGRLVHHVSSMGGWDIYSDKNMAEDDHQKITFYFVCNDKVEVIQEVSAGINPINGSRYSTISMVNFIDAAGISD